MRRGPFVQGEKVQFTDRKGKRVTVQLQTGTVTQTDHGLLRHNDIIGQLPGSVVATVTAGMDSVKSGTKTLKSARRIGGWEYTAMRPRMIDYSLSMPRGAQVMYPKDIAAVISLGDIRTGARVVESGGGSGAMTLALLDAVGESGHLTTIEQRAEFGRIASANIELYFGQVPSQWDLQTAGFDEGAVALETGSVDRIVFDLLDPWNRLDEAERIIAGGGVLVAYVTTTTQLSRLCERLKTSHRWAQPEVTELLERTWKVDGLAVRPDHQMIGHTGFLVTARAMAPGVEALTRKKRATKDTYTDIDSVTTDQAADDLATLELRDISDRKIRKVLRDLTNQLTVLHDTAETDASAYNGRDEQPHGGATQ